MSRRTLQIQREKERMEKMMTPLIWDSQLDKGRFLGLLEGEGTLTLSEDQINYFTPRLIVSNSETEIILEVERILNSIGVTCEYRIYKRSKPNFPHTSFKPLLYKIDIKGIIKLYPILLSIVDDLVGRKHDLASLLIKWCKLRLVNYRHNSRTYSEEEQKILDMVRKLNSGKAKLNRRILTTNAVCLSGVANAGSW